MLDAKQLKVVTLIIRDEGSQEQKQRLQTFQECPPNLANWGPKKKTAYQVD